MRRELTYVAVGALAATALAGGIAVAAIPGPGGTIEACYTKTTGALRLIDSERGQTCHPSKELAIQWSQAGPKGDPGPAGPAGPTGPKGDPGAAGEPGADGRSITWRGAFDCDALYSSGDVVSHDGSAWITDAAIGGCVNPPYTPWRLLAAKGADGAPGAVAYEQVYSPEGPLKPVAPGATMVRRISCPAGKRALSGGYEMSQLLVMTHSAPHITETMWEFWIHNPTNTQANVVFTMAVCG
jgi:hypothetical protein